MSIFNYLFTNVEKNLERAMAQAHFHQMNLMAPQHRNLNQLDADAYKIIERIDKLEREIKKLKENK